MTPASDPATCLPIGSDADLAWVRHQVRHRAAALGFGLVQQTTLVTAASELARNTLVHGGGGRVEITSVIDGATQGLRLVFVDTGPGIADTERAMADGYSSRGGAGLGLGGAKRLVDEFSLDSEPGRGTVVNVVVRLAGVPAARRSPDGSGPA